MSRAKEILLEEAAKHPNFGLLTGTMPCIITASETYAKEIAMGFYRFTEWKPENSHWFNQEGEIIDLEDVYNQYLEIVNPKKKGE